VVVVAGLTDCVPPDAWRGYEVPSEPVTVTCVAFVAVTVKVEELPGVMDVGLAMMLTTGAGLEAAVTVTVAVAEAFPPAPVAAAVYVVVVVGLTDCVPPDAWRGYEVPSDPVTETAVAFVATTVKMDAAPAVIEVGLALMVTVAAGVETAVTVTVAGAEVFPPAPVAVAV
jgi:hypothetical protein